MTAHEYDIVVAGEALIDLTATRTANEYHAHPGGGPANAAVALARLGSRTAFLGRISRDAFGGTLTHWLSTNGVGLSLAVRCDEPTTLAIATPDTDGVMAYTFYSEGTSNWQWTRDELPADLPGAEAFHIGSLASRREPGASLLDALRQRCSANTTIFVDPNFRASFDDPVSARTQLTTWLNSCDIVKLSTDDVAFAHPGADSLELARMWSTQTDVLVLVTDGPRGAHAFEKGEYISVEAPQVNVVDTIGAGDAFGAAFLHTLATYDALAKGRSRPTEVLRAALTVATACAAITCSRPGADPPTRNELPSAVERLLGPRWSTNRSS